MGLGSDNNLSSDGTTPTQNSKPPIPSLSYLEDDFAYHQHPQNVLHENPSSAIQIDSSNFCNEPGMLPHLNYDCDTAEYSYGYEQCSSATLAQK